MPAQILDTPGGKKTHFLASIRLLKNVTGGTKTRQKWEKNRSLHSVNEDF